MYNVEAFRLRLPEHMVSKGGMFFPMWQRETLWIEFRALESENGDLLARYAIKVSLGGLNAITGKPLAEKSTEQDYIVFPDQE